MVLELDLSLRTCCGACGPLLVTLTFPGIIIVNFAYVLLFRSALVTMVTCVVAAIWHIVFGALLVFLHLFCTFLTLSIFVMI
jgi:hypothetical protein